MGWHVTDDRLENLGRRIADARLKLGWTQQELADRIGVSRVAVSHLEAGMTDPGERTVALLAGVFKVEPHELVDGTTYPPGKSNRLPLIVARHTEVELQLALLDNDLAWVERVPQERARVVGEWEIKLRAVLDAAHDQHERAALTAALARLRGK